MHSGPTQSESELMSLGNVLDGKTSVDASSLALMARQARDGLLDETPIEPPLLNKFAAPARKGAVTLLCGPPGSSKSYLMSQNLILWHGNGIRCAARFLEDTIDDYLGRILAQVSGEPRASRPGFMKENFGLWEELFCKHRLILDSIAPCIEADDSGAVSLDDLLAWSQDRVDQGIEMLVIDPYTAASGREQPFRVDGPFIRKLKGILSGRAHCLIVSHTMKDGTGVAGGADLTRFVTSQFTIQPNAECKEYWCKTKINGEFHDEKVIPDRIVKIDKGRFGEGTGYRLAMRFDPKFLTFNDIGLIIPRPREA